MLNVALKAELANDFAFKKLTCLKKWFSKRTNNLVKAKLT
jgi:hypothetical protein